MLAIIKKVKRQVIVKSGSSFFSHFNCHNYKHQDIKKVEGALVAVLHAFMHNFLHTKWRKIL
jgi:hypothetical protein